MELVPAGSSAVAGVVSHGGTAGLLLPLTEDAPCSEDACLSRPAPLASPQTPWGRQRVVDRLRVPSPKACTPTGMESHRWASLQQQGTWMETGEGTPQEPTCAPSPRSQRRGRRAGTQRLGDGGAPCPPGIPSALLTTAPAGHSHSARILQNWPSRSRTPRLGTRWWLWSSSVLLLGFRGVGSPGKAKACPSLGAGLRERAGLIQGWTQRRGGASVGGAGCGRGSGLRTQRSGRGSGGRVRLRARVGPEEGRGSGLGRALMGGNWRSEKWAGLRQRGGT